MVQSMEPHGTPIRILIVADDPLSRAGLEAILSDQQGHVVVGQIQVNTNIEDDLDVYQPDVVLMDLGWHSATALERLTDLASSGIPVVTLVVDEADAAEALAAGSKGVLPRDEDAVTLSDALKAVTHGLLVVDPSLAPYPAPERITPSVPAGILTSREMEVLAQLAKGLPNKSIADRLSISEHTVKFHVNAILGKLGVQSRTEAAMVATRQGLIPL